MKINNFRVDDSGPTHTDFLNSMTEIWLNTTPRIEQINQVAVPSSKDAFFSRKPTTEAPQFPFPPVTRTEENPYLQPQPDTAETPPPLPYPSLDPPLQSPATTLQPEYTPSPTRPTPKDPSFNSPAQIPRSSTDPGYNPLETEGITPEGVVYKLYQTHPSDVNIVMEEMAKYQTPTNYIPPTVSNNLDFTGESSVCHHHHNFRETY
ncbi:unnamed protein product [Spodoptera littoralis]|uniref:Uncharacterized protein n=1 Tax=Spodoptera littoralis TaxID=7109 RepID=A0A9P0I9H8_SPOLI|nr:unnamed protein product [Spodoptera littoralis]